MGKETKFRLCSFIISKVIGKKPRTWWKTPPPPPSPQRWFLATESLSQIFMFKILISEIVYENWRNWQLTVKQMKHYGLIALCNLGYVNEKISRTFLERLFVKTLPDVVMSMGIYRIGYAHSGLLLQGLKSRFYSCRPLWQYRYAKDN